MENSLKIFFATDIHGSEICFRKVLNAGKFYGAEVVILGGDMTGKMVVPIIKESNRKYTTQFQNENIEIETKRELNEIISKIRGMGPYPYVTDKDEMESLQSDKSKADAIIEMLIIGRLREWIELADEKLNGSGIRFFVCPGNDDEYFINSIIEESSYITNIEDKIYSLNESHEIVSTGYSNPTPWKTPRELPETELEQKLEKLVINVRNIHNAIFNFHVPPYNSNIDECAELDSEFRVVTKVGHVKKKPAGSTAVRTIIEKYQPILGLFGHIHEGRGYTKIGRTLCINPGSNFQQGVLNGCLVTIQNDEVNNFQLIEG